MRRQRRRLVTVTVMLGLAGAVVVAHSAMGHDHMGDVGEAVAMCLAVAETAIVAAGAALALGVALAGRTRWLVRAPVPHAFAYVPAPRTVPARAGPPLLQVFRL